MQGLHFRRAKLGMKATTIHDELYAAYGDQAPSSKTVFRWKKHSRTGRCGIQDKVRVGRPVSETTESAVAAVGRAVDSDARTTMDDIAGLTGLSAPMVFKI